MLRRLHDSTRSRARAIDIFSTSRRMMHGRFSPSNPPSMVMTVTARHDGSLRFARYLSRSRSTSPKLPTVRCVVRTRIPTVHGADMFLHVYHSDVDDKDHIAMVFGEEIRSRSLDAAQLDETESDRMIRGAYVGRLRPGRTSSQWEGEQRSRQQAGWSDSRQDGGDQDASSGHGVEWNHQANSSGATATEDTTEVEHINPGKVGPAALGLVVSSTPGVDAALRPRKTRPCRGVLVRVHSECYTGETGWSTRCDCGEQLEEAARLMSNRSTERETEAAGGGGVIVYLRQEGRGIGLTSKLKAYNLQDLGADTVEANLLLRHPADLRTYGLATAILVDLGLGTDVGQHHGIRLLTNNPGKLRAVEGPQGEVRVLERVSMVPLSWQGSGNRGVRGEEMTRYLETKITKMGHLICDPHSRVPRTVEDPLCPPCVSVRDP